MNVTTVGERTENEFESEQRQIYGRIWKEEMEERNDVIYCNFRTKI